MTTLLIGFALSVTVGTALGVGLGWWRPVGTAFDPVIAGLYVVPMAALVPLVVAWFGIDMTARVIVVVSFSILDVVLSAQTGVRRVDPGALDVARTFGARRRDLLLQVALPASVPFLFVGYRIAASRAVKGMVVAEMLFGAAGLGALIMREGAAFRIDRMLAAVLVISMLGVLLTTTVRTAETRLTRWTPKETAR